MIAKLPRKLLIGILSVVVLTVLAISAVPVMAASTTTVSTTTTPTTTTITTTTPGTGSATAQAKPTVTGVDPISANQGQTLSVTITGTGFTGVKGVSFGGGIDVTGFSFVSDTSITANVVIANRAFVGTRFVTVATPAGRGTDPTGFSVTSNEPTVTEVSPNTGNQGQTYSVTVTGTNFGGATKVSFGGGINVTGFNIVNPTEIQANIVIANHAFVGTRFVTVVDASGHGTMSPGFSVTSYAPNITSVNPSTGVQGASAAITITGTNFTGATGVSFGGGIDVVSFSPVSDTEITASIVIANHAFVGSRFVTVVNQSGRGTDPNGFNVAKNESTVTPNSVPTTTPTKPTTTSTITTSGTTPPTTTSATPSSTTTTTTITPTTTTTSTPTTTSTTTTTTTH